MASAVARFLSVNPTWSAIARNVGSKRKFLVMMSAIARLSLSEGCSTPDKSRATALIPTG